VPIAAGEDDDRLFGVVGCLLPAALATYRTEHADVTVCPVARNGSLKPRRLQAGMIIGTHENRWATTSMMARRTA